MSLEREKKKKQLADAMKEAGVGQGIKGAVSDKVKQTISNVGKSMASNLREARTGVGREVAKGIAKGVSGTEVAKEVGTGGLASKLQGLKDAEEKALKRRKK